MATYAFTDRVLFPIDDCYVAMRDHMVELTPFLEGVKEIRVLEREEIAPGRHRIVNEWIPDAAVPPLVSRFVTPETLRWLDHVLWDDARRAWRYELEFPRLSGLVRCAGENGVRAVGPGETELYLTGELEIRVEDFPGVPAFLGRRVRPAIERFVVGLLEPRLKGIDAGLAKYLAARARA